MRCAGQIPPCVSQYILNIKDPECKFYEVGSLGLGGTHTVPAGDFQFFVDVAKELGSDEMLTQLMSQYTAIKQITVENVVGLLLMKQTFGEGDEVIAFIAKHFNEIEDLCNLGVHDLRRVLSHPELRIESEDVLYRFICSMMEKDEAFSELLEFVKFKYLGTDAIQHFISLNPSLVFDNMNVSMWNSLCARLYNNTVEQKSSDVACKKQNLL